MQPENESTFHPTASVEVLVIGGGVIGSSIAYHVARQGRTVLVVEHSEVALEPVASWASAGGIRLWEQDPPEAPLALAALARWPTLAEELDADLGYCQAGHLMLAENDAETEQLRTLAQRQRTLGFADMSFVDRQAAFSIVPGLGEQVVAGIFSPSSGHADPRLATRAFANAARRHGAIYWTSTTCLALQRVGDRVVGAQTERGAVQAQQTVLAAGAWNRELAAAVGIQLPLKICVLQVLLSAPAEPGILRPVLTATGREVSLKQRADGAFVVGGGWQGDPTPDGRSYTLRQERIERNWAIARDLFAPLRTLQRVSAWGGLQAQSIDDLPLIGSVPTVEGLALACASWYGFALSPAIGRSMADNLAGLPAPELDQLSPHRIAHIDPARVAAFIAAPET
jgi:sarcosine oxidase subunit beta